MALKKKNWELVEKYRTNLCEYKGKVKVLIPVTHKITNLKGGFH